MTLTDAPLSRLLSYCCESGRVCPQPQRWNELFQMLPATRQVGVGWEPSLPLILAAWWEASDGQKRERLSEHVRWANDHGALDRVADFLYSLPPTEWHYEEPRLPHRIGLRKRPT